MNERNEKYLDKRPGLALVRVVCGVANNNTGAGGNWSPRAWTATAVCQNGLGSRTLVQVVENYHRPETHTAERHDGSWE